MSQQKPNFGFSGGVVVVLVRAGMHWKGGRCPPSRAPNLCPVTVSLTPHAFVTDSNRPEPLLPPPPNASLAAPGAQCAQVEERLRRSVFRHNIA